jgi:hypothetical protein
MVLCSDGVPETYACSEVCPELGLETVACVEGTGCCGGFLDQACADGVIVACQCSGGCAEAAAIEAYVACYGGEDTETLHCLADYWDGTTSDCTAAEDGCSGGAPGVPPEEP